MLQNIAKKTEVSVKNQYSSIKHNRIFNIYTTVYLKY
jgi:hypothetical protein